MVYVKVEVLAFNEMSQVRAAFDFEAQPGTGELSIRENEVLTIIREVMKERLSLRGILENRRRMDGRKEFQRPSGAIPRVLCDENFTGKSCLESQKNRIILFSCFDIYLEKMEF